MTGREVRLDLQSWINKYEEKTGEKFTRHPNFTFAFFPDRGFCEICVQHDMVMAYQLCGDGHFWKQVIDTVGLVNGCSMGGAIAVRSIKPYIRYWGYKIYEDIALDEGAHQYLCRNVNGSEARISPAWKGENGRYDAYYVTWTL